MRKLSQYHLKIPKSNLEQYIEYILKGIYNFTENDLWFVNASPRSSVELVRETTTAYYIRFKRDSFISLVRVLPKTFASPDNQFYSNERTLNIIKDKINIYIPPKSYNDDNAYLDSLYEILMSEPGKTNDPNFSEVDTLIQRHIQANKLKIYLKHDLSIDNLDLIIKQLATDDTIQRYVQTDDPNIYLCSSQNIPLIIGIENGKFICRLATNIVFDVEKGFIGSDKLNKLNSYFAVWQVRGDVTAPILSPNNIISVD